MRRSNSCWTCQPAARRSPATSLDHAAEIVIPPLPSLVHDAAFFKDIQGRGFHGGLLDGLAGSYK